MRGVGVCAAVVAAAVLAGGWARASITAIEKERAVAEDSDDDDDDAADDEDGTADDESEKKSDETAPKQASRTRKPDPILGRKSDSIVGNIERDLVPENILFFSGTEGWSHGLFSHSGLLWAPQGLDGDGIVLKLLLNSGLYRYRSGRNEIVGVETMGAALLGARWHAPGLEVTVYAGLDVQDHRFLPNDPGNRLRGTHGGVRGGFDVWFEPVRNGMVTVSTSLSTIGSSYWMRADAGGRVLDMIWIGPEFIAAGDDRYTEMRVGAHITGVRYAKYEISLGGGWAKDNDGRSGAYGRLGILYRPYGGAAYADQPVPF